MENEKYIKPIIRYFPLLFFLLIAIFILIKFVFIVLFRAAFEPAFIFDLTPYYILSGINSVDLLLISLLVVIFDVYLHFKVSKKNLMFSFIPTSIMLIGLGIRITGGAVDVSYSLHYIIFGCLLFIALIDQKQILKFQDMDVTPKIEKVVTKTAADKSVIGIESPDQQFPIFGQPLRIEGLDELLSLNKQTLNDIRSVLKVDLQRAQNMMDELERKTERINYLSEEIEQRRKNLIEDEKLFRDHIISSTTEKSKAKSVATNAGPNFIEKTEETKINQPTMLDDFLGSAAIVKRGALKKVSQPFVELLGFDSNTLLEKNLVDLIVPECLSEFEKNYSNKPNDKLISSYNTVLLTKDNRKIHVEITIKPIIFDKIGVDLLLIRNLGDI